MTGLLGRDHAQAVVLRNPFRIALAAVTPAFAADLRVKERSKPKQTQQKSKWSGGQLGGSNGASSVNNNFVEPGAYAFGSWSDVRVGGTAGAGVETAIGGGWKARVEYRYTDYSSYTRSVAVNTICVAPTGCSAPSSRATIDLRGSFHTVRVGVGFEF